MCACVFAVPSGRGVPASCTMRREAQSSSLRESTLAAFVPGVGGWQSTCRVPSHPMHPNMFTFPAGSTERGATAATRETLEESGVTGRLGRRLGEVADGKVHTTMCVLHVEEEHAHSWQEGHERQRQWFDLGVPGRPGSEQAVLCVCARRALEQALHEGDLRAAAGAARRARAGV